MPTKPQANAWTAIIEGPNEKFGVCILPSTGRQVMVSGFSFSRDEAGRIELAINEAMIDFSQEHGKYIDELRVASR
ncbi:hypothetical protein LCGC14_2547630 [marine sediment metagenome]|uniref:Uncharacterized protein n=1 Tax=marine sediment metagenome TaxID=412755 RepID=A0A0F9D095_9ZZZZ